VLQGDIHLDPDIQLVPLILFNSDFSVFVRIERFVARVTDRDLAD